MPDRTGPISAAEAAAGFQRSVYPALGVSTLAHVGVILLLAGLSVSGSRHPETKLDTRWSASDEPVEIHEIERTPETVSPEVLAIAGSRSATSQLSRTTERPIDIALPTETPAPPHDEVLTSNALADDVGPLRSIGAGDATGRGDGDGEGDGFFGIAAAGTRFVYVVDCSLSMNHPHASPAKTRFKRLKLELVKSVGLMQPSQEFFIIFFNHNVLPMPARSMQPAQPDVKQKYLRWVTGIRADGDTDPRDAINLAMRLQPDVIYFLTDGSFEFRAKKALNKLSQRRIAIHTFALGNREGEPILRGLAERNGGKYHYIP